MSTIEDFENAPVGATATSPDGRQTYRRETKTPGGADWVNEKGNTALWADADGLAHFKYTLDPLHIDLTQANQQLQALTLWTIPDLVEAIAHGRVHIAPGHDPALTAPTSAREALDLAWELAYPVKEGQAIPADMERLIRYDNGLRTWSSGSGEHVCSAQDERDLRTLDPLPDTEPDWLNAPAVTAVHKTHYSVPSVWVPHLHQRGDWTNAITGKTFPWQALTDVTPLYPKEDA